jgi:hypothetical protein
MRDWAESGLAALGRGGASNRPNEEFKHKLTGQAFIDADPNTERLVLKAEAYFRALPNSVPEFDHFYPSEWLIGSPGFLDTGKNGVKETMNRAGALFARINKLIKNAISY